MESQIPEYCFSLTEASERFLPIVMKMIKDSMYSQDIHNIDAYQSLNKKNQDNVLSIISQLSRPNSKIVNIENMKTVAQLASEGKSCIIMLEHYSNFDVLGLYFLIKNCHPEMIDLLDNIVCLAAAKLNAEHKVVLAFSEAVHRIMIYPTREENNDGDIEQQQRVQRINQRAMKEMLSMKNKGKIILMFPSGTRYRSNKPESRQAIDQVSSFIKRFDYVCLIGIAGNMLMVNPNNNMIEDIVREDSMVYWVDTPVACKEFLHIAMHSKKGDDVENTVHIDKHIVADYITNALMQLHTKAETEREILIADNTPRYLGPIASQIC